MMAHNDLGSLLPESTDLNSMDPTFANNNNSQLTAGPKKIIRNLALRRGKETVSLHEKVNKLSEYLGLCKDASLFFSSHRMHEVSLIHLNPSFPLTSNDSDNVVNLRFDICDNLRS